MSKIWQGRTSGEIDSAADDFNSSIRFDSRMYREDIIGSMAHAEMLGKQEIITMEDEKAIVDGLQNILEDLDNGKLEIDPSAEDIHSFVEAVLTERIGEPGKKLHTARSRNDQVALDIRLYLRKCGQETITLLKQFIKAITDKAKENTDTVMPGYTHMQRAQPITFGHHLMAYAMMFLRDIGRMTDAIKRMNISPIGSCALAGTTYNIDRIYESELLGFDGVCLNSMDGVADRDFCLELCSALSIIMNHLSRFSEEIILWASWEFKFIELSDAYSTGSSIMPQKKNPDMAELARGKTGRVYGDLMSLLTVMKGLPLAYNKDAQEDKEAVFDAFDTVKACITVFSPMIETMKVNKENMRKAASAGFINATDLSDYLVGKGLPFRTAYKLVGEIVSVCTSEGLTLEEMPLDRYKEFSSLFTEDLYSIIDIDECVKRRISLGGPAEKSVQMQIDYVMEQIK